MQLDVIQEESGTPWYAEGLDFTCTQCGNCCTGGPGYVWISDEEIRRLAEFLAISEKETISKYCRKVMDRYTLKEHRTLAGLYDCIFLKELPAKPAAEGQIPQRPKACSIYKVRPLQCRTWPFWPENLASPEIWKRAAKRCHGMNRTGRHFPMDKIVELRDATDWPDNPPTSDPSKL